MVFIYFCRNIQSLEISLTCILRKNFHFKFKEYNYGLDEHLSCMFHYGTYEDQPAMVMPRFGPSLLEYLKSTNNQTFSHEMFRRLAVHIVSKC